MKDMPVAQVRNFALFGHTGSGKTTLLDALLFKLGVNDRRGSPEAGTSAADWTEEESERKITIWAKPFDARYAPAGGAPHRLVMMDTPGYADFAGQTISAAAVADAGLIVIDAVAGIQVGTYRAWRLCEQRQIPRLIVINGLDRENADFDGVADAAAQLWGARCIPITVPNAARTALADVLGAAPAAEFAERAAELKNRLIEAAAESDDALLEKFLGGEALTAEEIARGLRGAVGAGKLVPIFAVSAKTDLGLPELLSGIVRLLPSPLDRPALDAAGSAVDAKPGAPFTGFVWRSIMDPFVGQLSLVRVYGGTLKPDTEIFNATRNQKERIGAFYLINGKKQETPAEVHAGDIIAIPKLKHTGLNDSLCAVGASVRFAPVAFPNPVMTYAVTCKTQGDEDKLSVGLRRAADEDPTLRVERNTETHELTLSGMGDVQLQVAVENMRKHNKVEVELHTPKVAYKETITGRGEGHYKHKKQSGGRGQYGEVYLRVEPRAPGDDEWFVDAIVGGAIPGNFVPAVQKGVVEGLQRGAVAGYPVTGVKVTVYDGSYHEVDSSEVAFKIAAARALRDALSKAKPVLLEPIMKLTVQIPDSCMGDVTGDLNHRRGRILGMDSQDGLQVIIAEVPQAETFQYSSQLRSMTGGRGSFDMEFSRMENVPSNIAQRIIAEAQKQKHEEEE